MTRPAHLETPVLVVGAGPVGLSLALDLGWRGVHCTIIDAHDGKVLLPRASGITARTMEVCRRWGIAEEVRNCGFPADYRLDIVYCTSLRGLLVARTAYPPLGEQIAPSFTPENKHRCPQHFFDPVLERAALRHPSVRMLRLCRMDRFEQDADGVTAHVSYLDAPEAYDFTGLAAPRTRARGAQGTIRARWMVACDGAESPVRTALDIGVEGNPLLSYSVSILFRSPWLQRLHDKGEAERYMLVGEEGVWGNLTVVDGREEWRLTIVGSHRKLALESLDAAALVRRCLGADDIPFEITNVTPWRRKQLVAERLRSGRVFLAGDAAHSMSPTGGFGMSTGVGDTVDLGWKLEAAVRGWAGEALLDSYELERKPVGVRNTAAAAANFKPWTLKLDFSQVTDASAAGNDARHRLGEQLAAVFIGEWETWGTQLGYVYEGSPIVVPDGTPAPFDDPMTYSPTARPGARAPHAWLPDGRSTLDLFGRGFVLLRFGATPADASRLVDAAHERHVPLLVNDVADPVIARLYERALVLVRPDGHVAWRADAVPADALRLIDTVRGVVTNRVRGNAGALQGNG